MTTILSDVTIRLNAELDLVAAGLSADEADDFARVYREAAAAIGRMEDEIKRLKAQLVRGA
jgi:uncharacterized small protein (DUF1192 family)